jgi:rhamnogalacturonan hydrolase
MERPMTTPPMSDSQLLMLSPTVVALIPVAGVVYVPEGDYLLDTWVDLSNGTTWALQLDGVIYRNSSPSSEGYMFTISDGSDFELFSSTSEGAIQGSGYLYHMQGDYEGPRILSVSGVENWPVHDIALVDAPMLHFVISGATDEEVYNMAIRGGDSSGLDGIDVLATDIWIHDVSQFFCKKLLVI